MGLLGTMLQAGIAAYTAARRVFEDPSTSHNQQLYFNQQAMYNLLWSYYNNSMFERIVGASNAWNWNIYAGGWQAYKQNYNLYRNIRMIYNPTKRLVNFYAGQVYPGVLSEDGESLPDGVPLAVPFSKDTSRQLKDAVAQFWSWSNWQARKAVQVRWGAALGDVLIEIVDDVEHGTVSADIIWPGFIVDLDCDAAGNVKSYTMQYQAQDEQGGYMYRKEVDGQSFKYYRDDEPWDYGAGKVAENPYGFVPAVWIKHVDIGGRYGSPAMSGEFGRIDELNGLASHIHDQIHKVIGAPLVLWTNTAISNLGNQLKRPPTAEMSEPSADQESLLMLKGGPDGRVESLAGNLSLAEAGARMDRLYEILEKDHPELTFYEELRGMSQVTGPAASRLVGDVNTSFAEAAANYDRANIKLFQMAAAIGGFRAKSGAWGVLSRQQQKFRPFDLDSYERGDLDMAIMPRPLLVPTKMEVAQEKQAQWLGVQAAATAGVPLELVLRDEGWTEEQIAELKTLKDAAQQAALEQMRAQAQTQPSPVPAQGQ